MGTRGSGGTSHLFSTCGNRVGKPVIFFCLFYSSYNFSTIGVYDLIDSRELYALNI